MADLSLEKIVSRLDAFGYPVFHLDLNKDEWRDNKSFFVYDDNGEVRPGTSRLQYSIDFTLMFITLEDAEINIIEVIENLAGTGLIFDGAVPESPKVKDTDKVAKAITWTFHRVVRVMC